MPATHFTSVDLPAPLSPTSAVTSPGYTAKSTSWSTCTAPKLLLMPSTRRIGSVTPTSAPLAVGARQRGPPPDDSGQLIPAAVHSAWMPWHRSVAVTAPAVMTSLMLALVMASGTSRTYLMSRLALGSCSEALARASAAVVSPLTRSIASWAAASASLLTFLKTVMHWSPDRMYCRPWMDASCPVTGTLRFLDF